jgi:hypothetical protein
MSVNMTPTLLFTARRRRNMSSLMAEHALTEKSRNCSRALQALSLLGESACLSSVSSAGNSCDVRVPKGMYAHLEGLDRGSEMLHLDQQALSLKHVARKPVTAWYSKWSPT